MRCLPPAVRPRNRHSMHNRVPSLHQSAERRHDAELFQFRDCGLVRGDVAIGKVDVVLAKELLRTIAEHSTRV
jgi:hypothetical protein